MASVYFKKEVLGVSESDDALSLNEFNSGNAFADADTTVWGSALKENSTRGTMEFTKKYLNLVFEVHRDSFYDFLTVSYGKVILYGSRRTVSFVHNTLGNGMYTSQSNDTVDTSKSNKEVIIRIRIPTADIYNIGTIQKISCNITTNKGHNLGHTWNLSNDSISIHKGYKWYKENGILLYRDFIDRGGTYSQKTISPKSEYDGDIKIFSEIYYGGDQSGERYFTPSDGKIKVKISKMNFFNSDNIRIPSHLFFEGLDSNGASKTEKITLINKDDNGNYNDLKNTTEEEFDSNKLKDFSEISKAFLCFGGDEDNKMSAYTFSDGFFNTAHQKNVLLNFNKNTCVNNIIVHMVENGIISTQMKTELTGTISVPENFPFEFTTTAKLKHSENVNQDDLDITDFLSISNQTITLNFNKNYVFKEDRSNNKLSFEDDTPPKKGTYLLKCSVINKLNNKSEEYIFNFNDDYKIEITSISDEYMAFGGPTPQIRYIVATKTTDEFVNGNIIIPEETLVFPSISNDNNFRLYKTDTYQSSTPSIEEYYVGLHPSYHNNIDKKSIISVINQRKEVGYDTLKGWMDYTSTDEQKLMYIAYLLKSSEIEIHTQPYVFTLGRIQSPIFDNKKIKDGNLQYFLIDNGTDKILSTKENNGISQNQFIENRINSNTYFSLSRDGGNTYSIRERAKLVFTLKDGTVKDYPCSLTSGNLRNILNLLKTGQNINFDLSHFMDSNEVDNIKNSGTLDLKFSIEYIYKFDQSQENEIAREIWSTTIIGINFTPDISPFGIRKRGIIVNPKEGEDLEDLNNTASKKNTVLINVKDVNKTGNTYDPTNGIKIVFETGQSSPPIFEIFLDSDGQICFSNGTKTFKPFS